MAMLGWSPGCNWGGQFFPSFCLFLLCQGFKFLHSAASRHSSCNSSCHESSILVVRKPAFLRQGEAVFPPPSPGIYAELIARPSDVWAEFLFEYENLNQIFLIKRNTFCLQDHLHVHSAMTEKKLFLRRGGRGMKTFIWSC